MPAVLTWAGHLLVSLWWSSLTYIKGVVKRAHDHPSSLPAQVSGCSSRRDRGGGRMSLEQSRQKETGWLDLMEQGPGEERAARTETSSRCKVSWSAGAQGPGESERRGGLPRISLFRGARNLEYLPPPPPPPICRGEGCVVNISPPVFLTYSPPRVEKTLEGGSQLGCG